MKFKYNDIVCTTIDKFYSKFLMYREDTGTCVLEDFDGRLYQFNLDTVKEPTNDEVLRFLDKQIEHWLLMKQGAAEIVVEHTHFALRMTERIADFVHNILPPLKEQYEAMAVAMRLVGKHPTESQKLQDEYREKHKELNDAIFQMEQCKAARSMSHQTIHTNEREVERAEEKLKLFKRFRENYEKNTISIR